MIRLDSITLAYGERHLFDSASAQVDPGDRVGLVGANGAGKSTLLHVIMGSVALDSGTVEIARGVRLGMLAQEAVIDLERPVVEEVERGATNLYQIGERLKAAHEALEQAPPDSAAQREALHAVGELETAWEAGGGYRLRADAEAILLGLGFTLPDLQKPGRAFSGGWRMRVALARLLLEKPDYLLLDEPTNHLDMDSLRWLERFLKDYPGALLLVSHDRILLDRLCQRILHVDAGRLDTYTGNYTDFARERRQRREILERTARNQEREIARTERFIDRFRAQATKARQVQSRIKALNKVERIELEPEDDTFSFAFPTPSRGGEEVLRMEGIHHRFGEKSVLEGIDLTLRRQDRVALVGVNGAGKSTLSRIAAGHLQQTAGTSRLGYNIELGYFAQDQADILDPSTTVLQTLENVAPTDYPIPLRSLLGGFLFRGDDVKKKVGVLSGGEKNRLALCRMLVRPANLLILDEPTNHLDMRAKEILQQALLGYEGTLLVVSHDRAFLDPLVEKVIEIGQGRVREFPGTLSEYLARKDEEDRQKNLPTQTAEKNDAASSARTRRKDRAEARRQLAPLRTQIARHEQEISTLEARITELETTLADPVTFKDAARSKALVTEHQTCKEKLEAVLQAWEDAQATLESLDKVQ